MIIILFLILPYVRINLYSRSFINYVENSITYIYYESIDLEKEKIDEAYFINQVNQIIEFYLDKSIASVDIYYYFDLTKVVIKIDYQIYFSSFIYYVEVS